MKRARILRAHRKLVRSAAFAPRGLKEKRLATLRAWVRVQLKREIRNDR